MALEFNFTGLMIALCMVAIAPSNVMATKKTDLPKLVLPTPVPADCLHCICIVESNCKMPDPVCSMDVGSLSCGPFQIKDAYWNDATQKGGDLMGDWKLCTATMECSREAVQGYMARYAVFSRLGHTPQCEDFARIHNGGPNGFKNPATLKYWAKVQQCLQQHSPKVTGKKNETFHSNKE